MIQVSLVAYLVGGAFLNLAYWDVPYYLFVAIAVTRSLVRQPQAAESGVGREAAGPAVEEPETLPVSATGT